jgi:hypothetical protein
LLDGSVVRIARIIMVAVPWTLALLCFVVAIPLSVLWYRGTHGIYDGWSYGTRARWAALVSGHGRVIVTVGRVQRPPGGLPKLQKENAFAANGPPPLTAPAPEYQASEAAHGVFEGFGILTYGYELEPGHRNSRRETQVSAAWCLPLYLPLTLMVGRHVVRRRRRLARLRGGLCLTCGYDLRESPGPCPECGTERPSEPKPTSPA